ncbi:MAG: PqqD family protein [Elusimicrobiota bacterium]
MSIKLSPDKKLAWRIIEGKAYILNPEKSELHCLNGVATSAWEYISKGLEFEELCEKIYQEYDVKREVLVRDLTELLQELRKKSLIK